jgi:protein phosphatase
MTRVPRRDGGASLAYRYAYATDRGMVREQNEDAIAISEEIGLALIADGMGGYNAGEVASGLAAEFLVTHLASDLQQLRDSATVRRDGPSLRVLHALLRARIDGVNEAIIDAANRQPAFQGMGTTLAMLLFSEGAVLTLHLGDSRIYRMRDRVFSLLTRDHSLLQEQIDAGIITPGEARDSIHRNFVTRALGVDAVADPEINEYDVVPGDLYLICSDGLPDMLSDEEIFDLLIDEDADDADSGLDRDLAPEGDAPGRPIDGVDAPIDGAVADPALLEATASRLVQAANARGGRDNVSVVLASVGWAHASEAPTDALRERAEPDRRRA